jgi:hypothetical protein
MLVPRVTHAQMSWDTIRKDFGNGFGDIWHTWSRTVKGSKKDYAIAGVVILSIAGLSAVDDKIDDWAVDNDDTQLGRSLEFFRQEKDGYGSEFGSGRFLLPFAGGLWLVGIVSENRALRDAGMGCLAAHQAESIPRGLAYKLVSRRRPSTANGDQYDITFPGGEWEFHSFFAGHFANALGCVTVWSSRFHLGVLEPVLYAAAFAVGGGRVLDRKHWASDIVTGGVISYAISRSIARRQLKRLGVKTEESTSGWYITPALGGATVGWAKKF